MKTAKISENQLNAIIGSLLGDGWLTKPGSLTANAAFAKSHKIASKGYLYALYQKLIPFSSSFSERIRRKTKKAFGGKKVRSYCFLLTHRSPYFKELRNRWYPDGKKRVPNDLVLNPERLAWWFCDDGTNSWKHRRATIYSQSFTKDENEFLVEKLKVLGVSCYVGKTYDGSGSEFCIDISGSGYFDLIDMIAPFVKKWGCMNYKIDTHGAVKGLRRGNKTGVNGVHWSKDRSKWVSMIKIEGKSILLGRFVEFDDAVTARKAAELKYGFSGIGKAITFLQ